MRVVLFIYLASILFLSSCGSNEKPNKKGIEREQLIVDSISLIVFEDNQFLKDSIAFNELIGKILLNREISGGKEGPHEFLCDDIYKIVYQTPDSLVPLDRKMDLLQILVYFCRRTTNYYIGVFIPYKIREGNEEIEKKPFLLLPFIYTNKISPTIVKCILEQDSIQVPKDYFEYSYEVNNYLSTMPKNDLKETLKKIKTVYIENPNTKKFLTKAFQKRYSKVPGWTIM